jgi:hypothetical protein
MGYFCICALLFAIFLELRGCRSELEKIPTRIVDVNVSIQNLIEAVETTNRRLDSILLMLPPSKEDAPFDLEAELKKYST